MFTREYNHHVLFQGIQAAMMTVKTDNFSTHSFRFITYIYRRRLGATFLLFEQNHNFNIIDHVRVYRVTVYVALKLIYFQAHCPIKSLSLSRANIAIIFIYKCLAALKHVELYLSNKIYKFMCELSFINCPGFIWSENQQSLVKYWYSCYKYKTQNTSLHFNESISNELSF